MKAKVKLVSKAALVGLIALVGASVLGTGCVTTDEAAAANSAVAGMCYNQAMIEASRGNYREASKFNALGGMNQWMSTWPRQ
jgi:outer membrane protein assembly factor BamD (BamD/ComL family)